ncbi:hypothetical protein EV127DRAFT_331956 [Xylaria flabelliformis]|nr:hypothetical protein EV127DRAFT_331956 [Xylaria flabelliformis]
MAEEPTLPNLPKVSWDAHTQSFTNTRKRGAPPQPLFTNSSDPAIFSSDDDPHIDNYANGPHRKKRYVGSWFQQMPTSSDSTFGEAVGPQPKRKRAFERQWDSGVWMGSDGSVELDEDFTLGLEPSPESKLPQLRNAPPDPPEAPEEQIVRDRVDTAIEEGNPEIDLTSLNVTTISNESISRLAGLTLIPSVDKDVPFQQTNPEIGLYLSNNILTRAPGALFNLEHLTYLSLRNNQISELPPSIGNLRNLRELNLSLNCLRYLPGELLNLLKYPSALASLHIHPNPFYRPETSNIIIHRSPGSNPLLIEDHDFLYAQDGRTIEEIRQQAFEAGSSFKWQVSLLARSSVQYSDSRGSVLSRFHLPCETSGSHNQSCEPGENQHVTLQTESVSALSVPHLAGRASITSSKPSRVLSLFELASKSASRAAQTWDLTSYLPPQAPSCLLQSIDRIQAQSTLNGNLGTLPCSICGRQIVTPSTQWIEWWDISKLAVPQSLRYRMLPEPLSMDENENAIPFLKRGCSWSCVPKPMSVGQSAPGTVLFCWVPSQANLEQY